MYLSRLIDPIFIGNNANLSKFFDTMLEKNKIEKEERLKKLHEKQKLTDSQTLIRKSYVNLLENFANEIKKNTIFRNISNPILIHDIDDNILDYNDAFSQLFIQKNKIERPVKSSDIFKEDNHTVFDSFFDYLILNNKKIKYNKEYSFIFNDYKYKVTTSMLHNENNEFECFIKIFTAI